MSTKIPSAEARAAYQTKITKEAPVVRAHHRVTLSIKAAVKAAKGCLFNKFKALDKKKQPVHGTATVASRFSDTVPEGMWMRGFVGGEKLPTADRSNVSSTPDLPKVSKNKPTRQAPDCSLLSECYEETAEEWAEIARKVRSVMAKPPVTRIFQDHGSIHDNDEYIRYDRIEYQPKIVRQASIRSQKAQIVNCSWIDDVADWIDSDFELPKLSNWTPPPSATCSSLTAPEAWWAAPSTTSVPSLHHSLTTKTSFASQKGAGLPFARDSATSLPLWEAAEDVPKSEWDYALF